MIDHLSSPVADCQSIKEWTVKTLSYPVYIANSYIWWPWMDAETVKLCFVCQEYRPCPATAPRHSWEWPSEPWSCLHLDFVLSTSQDCHRQWSVIHQHRVLYVATVALCQLRALVLDRSVLLTLLKELSHKIYTNFSGPPCGASLSADSPWFQHVCKFHPNAVGNLSSKV